MTASENAGPDASEEQIQRFLLDLARDEEAGRGHFRVVVGPLSAMSLVGLLQLALRHPGLPEHLHTAGRQFVDLLGGQFDGTPGATLIRRGYDSGYDRIVDPFDPGMPSPPVGGHERGLLLTVRCPVCGQLPDMMLGPTQALCGNDDGCRALIWNPVRDAAEQLADPNVIPPLIREGVGGQEAAGEAFARRPAQVPGSAVDDVREREIRGRFHQWGYRCGDGGCGMCEAGKPEQTGANP